MDQHMNMEDEEINALIMMVTNYGAAVVLQHLVGISQGNFDLHDSLRGVSQSAQTSMKMWDEISRAIQPVANKVHAIETRYKGVMETRAMMLNAIKAAADKINADEAKE